MIRKLAETDNSTSTDRGDSWEPPANEIPADVLDFNPALFDALPVANNRHSGKSGQSAKPADKIVYRRINSAELATGEYKLSYLVDGILVADQPCVVVGPQKGMKTSIMIDLAISLATGGHFLGRWPVAEPINVGVMSGESGLATIQETAKRVAESAGVRLEDLGDRLIWSDDLPIFGHLEHMDALAEWITQDKIRLVMLDPAYLAMPNSAENASNLFAIGEVLRSVADVCKKCGAAPMIAHHMRKTPNYDPPELSNAAWAGWGEWARQWILLNRSEPFDPDSAGEHKLWLAVGGSAGHSGLWGLDIREGKRTDPGGRRWEVDIVSAKERRADRSDGKRAEQKREATAKQEADLDAMVKAIDRRPEGASKNILRTAYGMSDTRAGKALEILVERGIVEQCDVLVSNHKQPIRGYRRKPDND